MSRKCLGNSATTFRFGSASMYGSTSSTKSATACWRAYGVQASSSAAHMPPGESDVEHQSVTMCGQQRCPKNRYSAPHTGQWHTSKSLASSVMRYTQGLIRELRLARFVLLWNQQIEPLFTTVPQR